MSCVMKVFLLLAALVCISTAQVDRAGRLCECSKVWPSLDKPQQTKGIQINPASNFCSKMEIIVTRIDGSRYCLNPAWKPLKNMLAKMM